MFVFIGVSFYVRTLNEQQTVVTFAKRIHAYRHIHAYKHTYIYTGDYLSTDEFESFT
jgi:hypothetical protein